MTTIVQLGHGLIDDLAYILGDAADRRLAVSFAVHGDQLKVKIGENWTEWEGANITPPAPAATITPQNELQCPHTDCRSVACIAETFRSTAHAYLTPQPVDAVGAQRYTADEIEHDGASLEPTGFECRACSRPVTIDLASPLDIDYTRSA